MASISPVFLQMTVAIGKSFDAYTTDWFASGFFFGDCIGVQGDMHKYDTYLVTNRHVVQGLASVLVHVRLDVDTRPQEYTLILVTDQGETWTAHPTADVAVIPMNTQALPPDAQFAVLPGDLSARSLNEVRDLGFGEGGAVSILGFPLGVMLDDSDYVIARGGTVARIRDAYAGSTPYFLIDTTVFKGNSGGPVIIKPELFAAGGQLIQHEAFLIGLVRGYEQNFNENAHLAYIEPVDHIREAIRLHKERFSETGERRQREGIRPK